jgi:hypothetical protein
MRQYATMNDVMNAFEHNAKMTNAHDLIMAVYQTRQAKEAAKKHRADVNAVERDKGYAEWRRKIEEANIDESGGYIGFCLDPPEGLGLNTPASKEAHEAYTTASHRAGAAMRALMKYGKEHEA